ncbi:hypothetical protein [Longitalea arenae]|uniref:hypothetical protein n=1 Tax=Longitalea arenae TaxID=2812558 RepID=UPI0019688A92|nr:hypothetical protein [Longitalea arenae]
MVKRYYRKLRGYAFDPSFSSTIERRQTNEVIYKIKWEKISPGPCGDYIEIIDYDPTKQVFYEPLNLIEEYVLSDYGLPLSAGDPKFHQQQVYVVVMSIISQFEKALGRKVIWSRMIDKDDSGRTEFNHEFVEKLRIYPHALRQQNAFYSPQKVALLFGYFQAAEHWTGNNVPKSAVFTCLSPDIVAHETTHAILDSLHPYLRKDTNDDMLAFHEGFADIIALLQRFTFQSVVEEQIRNSRGDLLSPQNLLGDLAIQFGQAVSQNRRALRSFLVENDKDGKIQLIKPDPSKLASTTDPHARGGILVAAVFDAFARLYKHRVANLIRLATNGTGILAQGEIDPDLVQCLSKEACDIANKLMLICIRALDYCPPVDLDLGDYLRALITADVEHSPEDEDGLRYGLLESFRSWGVVPTDVNNYSVESLMWQPLEEYADKKTQVDALKKAIHYIFNPDMGSRYKRGYIANTRINEVIRSIEKILRENERKAIFEESKRLCAAVHYMFDKKFAYYVEDLEQLLGMNFKDISYHFEDRVFGREIKLRAKARNVFQVYRCRPFIQHNNRTGNSSKLLLITFLQKVYVDLKGSSYQGFFLDDKYDFRGGSTVIIDLSTYEIKYAIVKKISSSQRLKSQLEYSMNRIGEFENAALLMQSEEPFAALHIH